MNEHYTEVNSPEQHRRQEIVDELLRDSEGSVAIHTAMDLTPEEKQFMLAAQSSRIGEPAQKLSQTGGGWGEYGERIATDPQTDPSNQGEHLRLITLEDGSVDVRYDFTQPGYKDQTGRPGNVLNVQFVVGSENAALLKESLRADPSFINEVIEAQAKSVGVSDSRWASQMQPHYEHQFKVQVADKDRVLRIDDIDTSGAVISHDELVYGENKTLLTASHEYAEVPSKLDNKEQNIPYPAETSRIESMPTNAGMSEEAFEREVADVKEFTLKEIASYKQEGKSIDEIITLLEEDLAAAEERSYDSSLGEYETDVAFSIVQGTEPLIADLKRQLQQESEAVSAREAIDAALSGTNDVSVGATVRFEGNEIPVSDTYTDANGEQWLELADGRQIKAAKVISSVI